MYTNYSIVLYLLLGCMVSNGFYAQDAKPFDPELLTFNEDSLSVGEQKRIVYDASIGVGMLIGVSAAVGQYYTEGYVSPLMHWLLWLAIFSKGSEVVSENLMRRNISHDPRKMSTVAAITNGLSFFAITGYFGRLIDN